MRVKEILTYWIFLLVTVFEALDMYGRATHQWDLQLSPELSEAFRVVLVCWFGKGAYNVVHGWLDRRNARYQESDVEIIDESDDV